MRIDVDGVLFDSDGVLVDSEALVDAAWRRLAADFDLDAEALSTERLGVRPIDVLAHHLDGRALTGAVDRLEQLEVDLATATRPLPGAVELCRSIPADAWTIATSASRRLARVRWASAGLPEPATAVTADDVSAGKPDPEPYLVAAASLGLDPARCVVFEDSPSGGEAARRAGAVPIAVGAASWCFDPAARIDDLRSVAVTESSTRGFALTIDVDS